MSNKVLSNISKKMTCVLCSVVLLLSMVPTYAFASIFSNDTSTNEPNEVSYQLVFDANSKDATGTMKDQTVTVAKNKAATVAVNSNAYARDGFVFDGWLIKDPTDGTRDDKNLDDVRIPDKQELKDLTFTEVVKSVDADGNTTTEKITRDLTEYAVDNKITLTAVWAEDYTPGTVTISFDANGGEGSMGNQKMVLDNNDVALTACGFTSSSKFVGWNTKADGTGISVPDKVVMNNLGYSYDENDDGETEAYDLNSSVEQGKLTLYAQWEAEESQNLSVEAENDSSENKVEIGDGEYVENDDADIAAVNVQDVATLSAQNAAATLMSVSSLSATSAESVSTNLMDALAVSEDTDSDRSGDGTTIESLSLKWITEDTTDNGNASLLYVKPSDNTEQTVRFQVAYNLSGEHDYEAGDINITLPLYIFKDRNGSDYGTLLSPYPEYPSTARDFNYQIIGDKVVFTNTTKMAAATKGFIQLAFADMEPSMLVDMQQSADLTASIDVTTYKGNVLSLSSNKLSAQFDTYALVKSAYENTSGSVRQVDASSIPASLRVDGEDTYVLVTYITHAAREGNQHYSLDVNTVKSDNYDGFILSANKIGYADNISDSLTFNAYEDTYSLKASGDNITSWYSIVVAYPKSQFAPNTTYKFQNTVTYIMTEQDSGAQTTSTASASKSWSYKNPEFRAPGGHFGMGEWGNDSKVTQTVGVSGAYTTHRSDDWYASDISQYGSLYEYGARDGKWYGTYKNGINVLNEGSDFEIAYTTDTIGYMLPWTYDGNNPRILSNYGKRAVTMETENQSVTIDDATLTVGTDYVYKAVEFPVTPYIYKAMAINLDEDGNLITNGNVTLNEDGTISDGTFNYVRDSDVAHIPDVQVMIKRNGAWETYATASWSSGSLVITMADGTTSSDIRVDLPADTETFKTVTTSSIAGMQYYVRPILELQSDSAVIQNLIDSGFASSNTPSFDVINNQSLLVTRADSGDVILDDWSRYAYDTVAGYTTDIAVYPTKDVQQSLVDYDANSNLITLHYSANVEERSYIPSIELFEDAVENNLLLTETSGTWYDLLPKGVTPLMDTIMLRDGDSVEDAYVINNYKNSGRNLLVVKASLTPDIEMVAKNGAYAAEDNIFIKFDATYDATDMHDYGDTIHNVIAFESDNDYLGTADEYSGETDNAYGTNNVATATAFDSDTERDLMTGLDDNNNGKPTFVYAGVTKTIDILGAGRTSLSKDVQVNYDGSYGSGVYSSDRDYVDGTDTAHHRDAYVDGVYQYRLRMQSDVDTVSKNLIIYDSLENFEPADGNDDIDIGAAHWQGTFNGVDVSQLVNAGVAPVVYYSTVSGLELSDESDSDVANLKNVDLSNTSIWVKSSDYTGSLSDVKAIAVDASKKADGSDFELQPQESISVLVNMLAPSGASALQYVHDDTLGTTGAYAYNNAYLSATSIDAETLVASDSWVRKDYTKVGLVPYVLNVNKVWDDGDNRDGYRPDSVTLHLYANGVDTNKSVVLDASNEWAGSFGTVVPYDTATGRMIDYSVVEDDVPHYEASVSKSNGGTLITVTNTHTPETRGVPVTKEWADDSTSVRPSSVNVALYANDTMLRKATLTADVNGDWTYTFANLYKNEDGQSITYTIKEETPSGSSKDAIKSYVGEVTGDMDSGFVITNTYNPYGSLKLTKTSHNSTAATLDDEFEFTIDFAKDGEPVFDEMVYVRYATDGSVISEDTFVSGNTVKLKADEYILFKQLPEYLTYKISEKKYVGYTVSSSNSEGQILPNAEVTAAFTNEYASTGRVNLTATKVLTNRDLNRYQFTFQVLDENDTIVRTASNAAMMGTTTTNDGYYSYAPVTFGALTFNQSDDGHVYTYKIKERIANKSGYVYDDTVYLAKVKVTDNGDGTLALDVSYTNADGTAIDNSAYSSVDGSIPLFVNKYEASGATDLTAYKAIDGRTDKSGFMFQLKDENGKVLQTKMSQADGTIAFDDLQFDETSIGKDVKYTLSEVTDISQDTSFVEDSAVVYDTTVYTLTVSVNDNGDGTLSFMKVFTIPQTNGETQATENIEAVVPLFTNELKPGSLTITKLIEGLSTSDQAFKLHIQFSGENAPEDGDEITYHVEPSTSSEGN